MLGRGLGKSSRIKKWKVQTQGCEGSNGKVSERKEDKHANKQEKQEKIRNDCLLKKKGRNLKHCIRNSCLVLPLRDSISFLPFSQMHAVTPSFSLPYASDQHGHPQHTQNRGEVVDFLCSRHPHPPTHECFDIQHVGQIR